MVGVCPQCGSRLKPIAQGELHGVRCEQQLCPFNFADQRCPTCSGDVVSATHPELGRYVTKCANGHEWDVT